MGQATDPTSDHAARADSLLRLAQTVGSRRSSLTEALALLTEAGAAGLGVERCSIWTYDESRCAIRCLDLYETLRGGHERGQELRALDYPHYFSVLAEQRVIAADEARGDARTREFRDAYLVPLAIESLLDAPIWVEGAMVGVVCHEQVGAPRRWTTSDESFAGALADLAALALEADRLRRSEREARELELRLERSQRLESVGRLAGGVAHDFNNMLTVVTHGCEELLEGLPPGSALHAAAERIAEAARRSTSLTRQLLAFSARQPLDPKPLDLNSVVADVDRLLRPLIGEDIQLRVTPCAQALPVLADVGRLSQVLVNLVVNARDAMPQGGTVSLSTQVRPATDGGPAMACLSVADTGTGIDPAHRELLFEPFFTTKPEGQGTGLGLASVFGICRQFGGRVEVESSLGQGARFDVLLPLLDAPAPELSAAAQDAPAGAVSTARLTILLVEDEQLIRDMVAEYLELQGHQVLVAGEAEQALALADAGTPLDLLISDVVMPGLTGFELWQRLREERPELSAVFMSGYSDRALPADPRLPPAAAFLPKPFRLAELGACLARFAAGRD